MLVLSTLALCLLWIALVEATCAGVGGTCKSAAQCKAEGKIYITGQCSGSNYCCYNRAIPCDNGVEGYCGFIDGACAGQFAEGLCKNWFQPAVKCCQPPPAPTPPPPTPPPPTPPPPTPPPPTPPPPTPPPPTPPPPTPPPPTPPGAQPTPAPVTTTTTTTTTKTTTTTTTTTSTTKPAGTDGMQCYASEACCSATTGRFKAKGEACASKGGDCVLPMSTCSGTSALCMPQFKPDGTACFSTTGSMGNCEAGVCVADDRCTQPAEMSFANCKSECNDGEAASICLCDPTSNPPMASSDCWNDVRVNAFAAQASDDYMRYGRDCPSFCSCVCTKMNVAGTAPVELAAAALVVALVALLAAQ